MCMCKNCSVCGLINRSRKVVLYLQRHVMVMDILVAAMSLLLYCNYISESAEPQSLLVPTGIGGPAVTAVTITVMD